MAKFCFALFEAWLTFSATKIGGRVVGKTLALYVALGAMTVATAACETAASTPEWNLTPVFAGEQALASEVSSIDAALPGVARWQKRLADPAIAAEALDARSALKARLLRVSAYASMRLGADGGDAVAIADSATAAALASRINIAFAYLEPELIALGQERLASFITDPHLARHKLTLEKLAARAPHVLPAEQERMVAGVAVLQAAPSAIRDTFISAELPWPSIDVRGETRRLTLQAFRETMRDSDRSVRRLAWERFTATNAAFQQTAAALLSAFIAGEAWEAKLRHWPNQVDFVTADDPMPSLAFAALADEAQGAVQGPLTHYLALKGRFLGLTNITGYDLAAPFYADDHRFTIEEAKSLTLAGVAPLGREYRDRLARGMQSNLMDWSPRLTKGQGATTFYVAPDIPGYVQLSFTGHYDDVAALAHEWGHWINWDYARTSGRPYETLFPPVTIGDVPSLVHEMLVVDRQISDAPDRKARIIALTNAIDVLRTSYYGLVGATAFDIAVRTASDRGEPLDADHISSAYCSARKRFSPSGIAWDARDCLGWVSEPYMFFDMYFYRYLLATSAAAWFAEKIEAGDKSAISRYKMLLSSGGSASGPDLLRTAGFDPDRGASYSAMTRRLERLVAALDRELSAPTSGTKPLHKLSAKDRFRIKRRLG